MKKLLLAFAFALALCGQAAAVPMSIAPTPGAQVKSSGNVANAVASVTVAPANGQTTYVEGVHMTSAGATAALAVDCTVVGMQGGTYTFTFVHPALGGFQQRDIIFNPAIPAATPTSSIVASCPAGGSGAAHAAMSVEVIQQ